MAKRIDRRLYIEMLILMKAAIALLFDKNQCICGVNDSSNSIVVDDPGG